MQADVILKDPLVGGGGARTPLLQMASQGLNTRFNANIHT